MTQATITGEVTRITYENEESGFRVVQIEVEGRGPLTVVGRFQFVAPGTDVRVTGEFSHNQKHGEQFKAHSLVTVDPTTLDGLKRYLGSGLIPGIGPSYATRIVDTFGLETLTVLDQTPQRLKAVPGLGAKRRAAIAEHWTKHRATATIRLLLQTHNISGHLANAIIERYGDRTAEIVQTSPYRLAIEVRGIGFRTADSIASSLGIARDHPDRVSAGVVHTLLAGKDQGHVCLPSSALIASATAMLSVEEAHVSASVDALYAQGRIVLEQDRVFLRTAFDSEMHLAERLTELVSFQGVRLDGVEDAMAAFESEAGLKLAPQQRRAVQVAATHSCVVITGGPGVGKTTIVRAILHAFTKGGLTTKLAAPTGRAAKRLSESTGETATTIHRLLEYDPKQRRFTRNQDNPIPAQAVIIDETSMLDLDLAEALVDALPERVRLVVVGDVDQLPSVGAGAVLRDVINSEVVEVVRLNRIFRQADRSLIVSNAHRILSGQEPTSPEPPAPDADFFIIERRDAESAARTVVELVSQRIPRRFGVDPKQDIQVLSPMHRGAAGTENLNAALQTALTPADAPEKIDGFLVGDRVMQLKNDHEREVFNGDIGVVAALSDGVIRINMEGRLVDYRGKEREQLTLAYATTIHKSQGGEYPAVVIPFLMPHFVMLSRNLLYTAVTRARRLCVLVADRRAVSLALSELRKEERHTRLCQRLQQLTRTSAQDVL